MNNVKVSCAVEIYEKDDEEVPIGKDRQDVLVKSHWNRDQFVVLAIEGKRYTVLGHELIAAARNAMSTG